MAEKQAIATDSVKVLLDEYREFHRVMTERLRAALGYEESDDDFRGTTIAKSKGETNCDQEWKDQTKIRFAGQQIENL